MLLELRAARQWQVRPSQFREWANADRVQAVALVTYEASIGRCGHSHIRTMDPAEDLGGGHLVMAEVGSCPACEALDEWNDDSKREKSEPGAQWAVVNIRDHPELDPERKE